MTSINGTGVPSDWQIINLGECFPILYAAQHEFMHALGFEHEHARPDRDDYIMVNSTMIGYSLLAALDSIEYTNLTFDYEAVSQLEVFYANIAQKPNTLDWHLGKRPFHI